MRTLIGWISALFASALIGAAMYNAVLSDPIPQAAADTVVERTVAAPGPQPTVVRTEVREVVEPTPTVTVDDVALIAPEQPAATPATPATTVRTARTPAPTSPGRGEDRSRYSDDSADDDDRDDADEDDEDDDADTDDDAADSDAHEDDEPEDD